MPYIKPDARKTLEYMDNQWASNAGELNYLFTLLILKYIQAKGESYQIYNDVMGALEGCKMELYRRKIASYENKKIEDNSDVY